MSLAEEMAEAMELETASRGAAEQRDHRSTVGLEAAGAAGDMEMRYARLEDWVHDWLYPQLAADRTRRRPWCSQWYLHPEAVGVLGALWHQWEVSRLEPMVGMSTFYVHYYLPLIGYLIQPNGTFGACAKASSDAGDTPAHRDATAGHGPPPVLEPDKAASAALAASPWLPDRD